ncbi:hypothetical protein LOK74_04480 [Brevibacillus humidisoli]|uniref:hypothetical protein n=1 Tax=Brevibacillus humidisoli TaxID=2895522 RepID=UPI001E2D98FD|nr:hypothetical protein [Brevibacillus humidisoli]UFJ41765.1 hypothetical protein LOK74_04480 [Brevibacillus humidisoli]
MQAGFFLACAVLVVIWFMYAIGRPLTTLKTALFLTSAAWIPSLFYPYKEVHYAGYFLLAALIFWISMEILRLDKKERIVQ